MAKTYRNDRSYRAKADALKRWAQRTNAACVYPNCGKTFNWDQEGTKDYWKHPMSFTANHINAVANGGSMTGDLEPMHRACNARLGTRDKASITRRARPKTTRDW